MKRKTIKQSLLFALLFVVSSVFLWNCEKEEILSVETEQVDLPKVNRRLIRMDHFMHHHKHAYEVLDKLFKGVSNPLSKNQENYSEEHNLFYILNNVYLIEGENYEQISFAVRTPDLPSTQFQNYLLMLYPDGGFQHYLVTYEYDSPERDSFQNIGIIELQGSQLYSRYLNCVNAPQLTPMEVERCTFTNCTGVMGSGAFANHGFGDESCRCGITMPCSPPSRECTTEIIWTMTCGGGSTGGETDCGRCETDDSNSNGQTGGGDTTGGDTTNDVPVVPIPEDILLYQFEESLDVDERAWWDNPDNRDLVSIIKRFLIEEDYVDEAILWAEGQIELEVRPQRPAPVWIPEEGVVAGMKYVYKDEYNSMAGSTGFYYKMEDGSVIFSIGQEQKLTRSGDLKHKFADNINYDSGIFYYIKIPGFEWAEVLYHPDSLFDGLKVLFHLAAIDLGKSIGRYVLPIEDIKILIDGRDFDGNVVSRWQAAGFLLLAVVPGGKALKVVDDVVDAAQIAIKLNGGSMVIDLVQTGLRVVTNNGVTRFLNNAGTEIARLVDGVLTYAWNGFGGAIVSTANKTTTLIGRWADGLENVWNSGLARQGDNVGGFNVLGDIPVGATADEIWAVNKPWLEEAMQRGDIIRVTADPSIASNIIHHNPLNISFNSFEDVIQYMSDFQVDTDKFRNLGFFGKEIFTLLDNGYTFDPITYTFKL